MSDRPQGHIETEDRPEVIRADFEALEAALKSAPWREPEHGRKPEANEFMWMHRERRGSHTVIGFKHCNTRNYIFLSYTPTAAPKIYVPRTLEPFLRGQFDLDEVTP